MNIKIWDSVNEQWLEPIAIHFGKGMAEDTSLWRVTACEPGKDPLSEGWYDIQGKDLEKIAIVGDLNWCMHLLPHNSNISITTPTDTNGENNSFKNLWKQNVNDNIDINEQL